MRGKGLIMLGGFHSFGPGGYYETALDKVLPVTMDRTERQPWNDKLREDVHLQGPVAHDAGAAGGTAALRPLVGRGRRKPTKSAWAKLPPLEGANLFRHQDLRPGAVVLADTDGNNDNPNPLLVTQTYRQGPRDRLRRRFDLALVDGRFPVDAQALLAADRALAGAEGPGTSGQRLGTAGQHPLLSR